MRMVIVRYLRLALVGLALAGYSGQAQTESSADPVIEQARQAAVTYAQSLLRYTVQRTTKRYLEVRSARISGVHYTGCIAAVPGANQADCEQRPPDTWGMLDVVTADVVTDHGHEVSLNLRVNDAPATEADVGRGGYWGEGEAPCMALRILDRSCAFGVAPLSDVHDAGHVPLRAGIRRSDLDRSGDIACTAC